MAVPVGTDVSVSAHVRAPALPSVLTVICGEEGRPAVGETGSRVGVAPTCRNSPSGLAWRCGPGARGAAGGEAARPHHQGGLHEDGIRSDGADVATTARWFTDATGRRDNRTSSVPAAGTHHRGLGSVRRWPDHVRSRRKPPLRPVCVGRRPSAILGPCHAAISLTPRRNAFPTRHPRVAASGGVGPATASTGERQWRRGHHLGARGRRRRTGGRPQRNRSPNRARALTRSRFAGNGTSPQLPVNERHDRRLALPRPLSRSRHVRQLAFGGAGRAPEPRISSSESAPRRCLPATAS